MIDKLRFLIDNTDNPKTLELLVKVSKLKQENQENALKLIELVIDNMGGNKDV